jgi:hypothetical protein
MNLLKANILIRFNLVVPPLAQIPVFCLRITGLLVYELVFSINDIILITLIIPVTQTSAICLSVLVR